MAKPKLPKDIKVDLPPTKAERTLVEIQQEYANLAAKVGQNVYQSFILSNEAEMLKKHMQELNFEASSIKSKETQPNG